jgi:hypothetical protein
MTTLSLFKYAFQATAVLALFSYLPSYLLNTTPLHEAAAQAIGYNGHATPVWLVVFLSQLVWSKLRKRQESQEARASVYGLQHGRLHLQLPTAMWMNMGYWKVSIESTYLFTNSVLNDVDTPWRVINRA